MTFHKERPVIGGDFVRNCVDVTNCTFTLDPLNTGGYTTRWETSNLPGFKTNDTLVIDPNANWVFNTSGYLEITIQHCEDLAGNLLNNGLNSIHPYLE